MVIKIVVKQFLYYNLVFLLTMSFTIMKFDNVLQHMKPCIRLNKNNKGRDFIIGDIHGFYNDTINLLDNVNFDPVVDRVFQCGDLTDRGPDSLSWLS